MRRIYRETPAGPIGDGSGLEHTPALMESSLQVLLLQYAGGIKMVQADRPFWRAAV